MSRFISEFLDSGAIVSLSPDRILVGWGDTHHPTFQNIDCGKPAFYFSDFFFKESIPWIQYSDWLEISGDDFTNLLEPISPLNTCDWSVHKPEQFRQAFDELWQSLQTGQLQKGVPYLFANSTSHMTKHRLQHTLKTAVASLKKKTGYLYGKWNGLGGVLGVTPELLFSHTLRQPQRVHTMALAGTCHPSHCQESFMKNEKEQHEHRLVVQGICQSLQSIGTVEVGTMQLLQLPRLTHLMTPIEVQLNQPFHFEQLVRRLHPTPALGAFPIEEGRKWLEEYQKHTPRHYYGAPIGFRHSQLGISNCFVGIRNVQWDATGMRIGAGCGVVKQSTFEKEWQEIQFKIRAIRDQLYL
jgi:menaquinone-specific isochorismate synthase